MRLLHEKLDARRKELGLTYEAVQALLEKQGMPVSVSAVGHWFTGEREPRKVGDLAKLCAVLETSLAEILGDDIDSARDANEQLLLKQFRLMTREQRAAYLVMAQTIAKPSKEDGKE